MSSIDSETPVPGTGETPAAAAPGSSAGTQNTDTGQGTPPETIPYSRFKEVNDRLNELRPYEELAASGLEPDSLAQLAVFEASYMQDPVGVTASLVDNLDLPEDRKSAVKLLLQGELDHPAVAQGESSAEGEDPNNPPAWAKPLVEDYVERHQSREAQARDDVLNSIIGIWDAADKKDGIETPVETKLAYIAANAVNGTTPEQVAQIARDAAISYREHILGGAVSEVRTPTGSPLSVPGSRVAPTPGVKITSMKQATALARQALESGQLPS
jgi:hypothetical protein